MSPFHPTVVRGFSKYTRITRQSVSANSRLSPARRRAYSKAAIGSWIEQGPTITSGRRSSPESTRRMALRPSSTVVAT